MMKLVEVDYTRVRADLDTGAPTHFNTCFHAEDEAPGYTVPSSLPYAFDRWLPLILKSRGLEPSACQVVPLSRSNLTTILSAAASSIHTGTLSRAFKEDLRDEIYPVFSSLKFPSEGLFMRLGACSLKDAALEKPGQLAVHRVEEAVLQMSTSLRAYITLTNILKTDQEVAKVYCVPFDARMDTKHEFRVFCVPRTLGISAVSQYRWHKPWVFAHKTPEERRMVAEGIMRGIRRIHADIITNLQHRRGGSALDDLIYEQGFSFDVLNVDGGDSFVLVELNSFGVRGACGSCLFQWINDRDVLYGKDADVEFRVAV